jgi:hypothetical protein
MMDDPDEKSCPPGSIIRGGMPGKHPDNNFARFIDVGCYRTTSNYSPKGTGTGSGFRLGSDRPAFPGESVFGDIYNYCPGGEAVIGIQGRSGLFVDAIGLICGAFTEANPSPPEPRPEACRALTDNPVPEQWTDMLRAHNGRRAQHCVAAPRMVKGACPGRSGICRKMHPRGTAQRVRTWQMLGRR